jgi:peptidoglycan/LPS O-acetylase OafA/YrhL
MMNCWLFYNYYDVPSFVLGFLHTVLSWKIFQPLSRLTFCIYLVHLPLITTRTLMTRVPIYFDGANAVS